MKYKKTASRDIPYPDHIKIKLNPHFKSGQDFNGNSFKRWDMNDGETELVDWLAENVGKITGYCYDFPMRGEGWELCECGELDYNPDDFAWRRLNYYEPQGEFGYYLILHDLADPTGTLAIQLMLGGLIQRARTEMPRSWKR